MLDAILTVWRLLIIAAITRCSEVVLVVAISRLPLADLYIVASIAWCSLLGFGTGICIISGDQGLGIIGCFLAMGTVGGMSARNPGTPRITILPMFLIIVPLSVSASLASAPLVGWIVVLAPFYLMGMISINRQLHDDYVELIVGRIDNGRLALHCPLTELPNRILFNRRLSQAVEGALKWGKDACLLCLDLDGFKQVNDEHGHPQGDLLLKQVAARLVALTGPDGTTARLGGDEFAMIVPTGDLRVVEATARSVVASLKKPFHLGNGEVRIGVSVGIARTCGESTDQSVLFAKADVALYAAKKAGKGTFSWSTAVTPERVRPTSDARAA